MLPAPSSDDGAVAVLVAVLLPLMLAFAGFGIGALLVAGGDRELQRAVDAAALATAASLPLAELTGAGPSEAVATGCDTARANLSSSRITAGFAATDVPDCGNGGVVIALESELGDLTNLQTAVDELHDRLVGSVPVSLRSVTRVCTSTTVLGETVEVCEDVEVSTDQLLTPPVDLAALIPALLTPRVRVRADHTLATPLGALLGESARTADAAAAALARRRVKNAVLLPVADCPGLDVTLSAAVATPITKAEVRAAIATHCDLGDPNSYAAAAGDRGFAALHDVAARLHELEPAHAGGPACLLEGLNEDLLDLYDPPGGGHVPTAGAIVRSARPVGEDVLVVAAGVVGASAIPVLDVFAVPAASLEAGNVDGAVSDLATARGVFRASLLDETAPTRVLECLS